MRALSLRVSLCTACLFCPLFVAHAAPISYLMTGDFPGSNPILVGAGVDLGMFSATFDLDSAGDPVMQTTLVLADEATTGMSGFPDTDFEVTAVDTVEFHAFVPAASSLFMLDTYLDGVLTFGGPVGLNTPLIPLMSGTVTLGVEHPQAGRQSESGFISSLTVVPEPASLVMLSLGGLGAPALRRHRR